MKLLVIGSQLSGKTTLVRYLRKHIARPVYEIDEEILKSNNNEWPADNKYKDEVLIPEIYRSIALKENVILFINLAFPVTILQQFKDNGFKIVLLKLDRGEISRRNNYRMEHEGYEDATPWIDGQLANYEETREQGLIDKEIDATESTESIAKALLDA
jgi:hypothetical protein